MLSAPGAASPLPALPALAAARSAPALAYGLLVFLVLALQFGPAFGLVAFRLTGDERWALGGATRDVAVMLLVALAAAGLLAGRQPGDGALPASARWALLMVAAYIVLALRAPSEPLVLALNLRRLLLVPLLFVALSAIPWSTSQVDRLFALIVGSSIAVALLGVGERLAPEVLWTTWLDIERYTAANALDRFGLIPYHESGRFFSWDLERWTGVPWRRMVSTYLEPTTLAAAMAVLLVLARARRARGHPATMAVVLALLCGLATLSKGYVLFIVLLVAWRLLGVPSPRHLWLLAGGTCAAAMVVAAWHLDGPLEHVAGLSSALAYLTSGGWLGEGIGNAGNYTNADNDVGEESGLGNVIGQVGIVAVLSLAWVSALARDVLRAAAARSDPGGVWVASWLVFWTVTYLLSASSLGVGGNALGFIALALYLHPASGPRGT